MASIYNKPVWLLMKEMVESQNVKHGQILTKDEIRAWFQEHYSKIKDGTIAAHLLRMSVNAPSRIHYNAKPDDDLFYQLDRSRFRLYDPENDPPPIYEKSEQGPSEEDLEEEIPNGSPEFAYEKDLQNYLSKNLELIEDGLKLFEEDGINGVEFPVGGRFIDILATDSDGNYVVIELKVSRGYDRVVGQLLRYMTWIKHNHAEDGQSIRGVIVAREISEDLILACEAVNNIKLFEYELSIKLEELVL